MTVLATLHSRAVACFGVGAKVSVAQLTELMPGVSRHAVNMAVRRDWKRVDRGVYVVPDSMREPRDMRKGKITNEVLERNARYLAAARRTREGLSEFERMSLAHHYATGRVGGNCLSMSA